MIQAAIRAQPEAVVPAYEDRSNRVARQTVLGCVTGPSAMREAIQSTLGPHP